MLCKLRACAYSVYQALSPPPQRAWVQSYGVLYHMVDNFGSANFMERERKPSELLFCGLNFVIATWPLSRGAALCVIIDVCSQSCLIPFVTEIEEY